MFLYPFSLTISSFMLSGFCLSCVFTVYFGLRTSTFHASSFNSSARFISTARASIPNTKTTLSDHRSKFPVSEKSVSPRIHIPSAYGSTTSIARSPFPRGQVYPFYRPIVTRYIPGTILQVQYLLRIRKRHYQRRISPYPLMRYIHSSLTFPIGTRYRSIHIYQRLFKSLFPSFCPHPTPHPVYALHETPDIFRRKPPRKITSRCWIRYPLRSHCIQIPLIVPVQLYIFQSHSTGKVLYAIFNTWSDSWYGTCTFRNFNLAFISSTNPHPCTI